MKPAFTRRSRQENLTRLRSETFDVLILGGGINGAGVARDLALRNPALKVALVEQRHFASGTSGRNSQLIHGGLRYLKNLEFRLVRESLHERATLLAIAPHLVKPLRFLLPMYGWPARLYYGAGLQLYDLLAGARNVGAHRVLSRHAVQAMEPGLASEGLSSGALFYDCLIHSARFVLENLFDAARAGAAIVNYCRAERYDSAGDGGHKVHLTDMLSGDRFECGARRLVDATGPWSDSQKLRLVRGSHLIMPRLTAAGHAIAFFEASGRIVFVIPWGAGDLSLVGTTDVDHSGTADDVRISAAEVDYLLAIVRRLFPRALGIAPISAYSSLRPLLSSADASPTKTSREHRIWASNGVVHIAGGKFTTYRVMSDEACTHLTGAACRTGEMPLGGNSPAALEGIPPELEEYGVLAGCVRDYARDGGLRTGRIRFAVEHEMVERLPDLLFVSTYWGYEQPQAIPEIAAELGRYLGWDRARIDEEVHLALALCSLPSS
jgi:glycerol-3-phosphate dehydrogenase